MVVSQSELRRIIAGIVLALSIGSSSASVSAGWYKDGIDWFAWPTDSSAGDCFGNCGAACSSTWNICGGRAQYWDLQWVSGPTFYQTNTTYQCMDGWWWEQPWDEYHAIGQWIYYGYSAPLCQAHDLTCAWWQVGCLWAAPCGDGWNDQWYYQEWMRGAQYGEWTFSGGSC